MKPKLASEAILPLLEEEDFEQMRRDTRELVDENTRLRKRVALLELHIITSGWVGWTLH